MPLFMDFHELDEFSDNTIEELRQGHKLDLAVQVKYNVEYKHYYISRENRKAFCVMEGPDKESCEAVHREAHGLVACNIVEVELNKYGLIMGLQRCDPDGMHIQEDGTIDSGLRTILLINTLTTISNDRPDRYELSDHFLSYSNELREALTRHGGRELATGRSETTCAFTSCIDAVQCGFFLQERISHLNGRLKDKKVRFETTIVLHAGEPVTRNSEFFGDTIQLARRLSHLGKDGDVILSSSVNEHAQPRAHVTTRNATLKITGVEDERFVDQVIGVLESKIKDENFSVIELSERAGISRPHLYRKIHNLFDQSPNHLINEMRLKEAVKLIHKKFGNISEIAYQVGYNNPSYFAKCFQKRFGILPSWYSMQELRSA
jgi:AraC-like DNA-binding protein